jgi:hypothetical protein
LILSFLGLKSLSPGSVLKESLGRSSARRYTAEAISPTAVTT